MRGNGERDGGVWLVRGVRGSWEMWGAHLISGYKWLGRNWAFVFSRPSCLSVCIIERSPPLFLHMEFAFRKSSMNGLFARQPKSIFRSP